MSPSRVALLTLGLAFLAACGGDTQSGSPGDAELARDLSLAPAESVAQLDDRPPEQPRPRPPAPQPRREPPPPPPPERAPEPEPPGIPTVEQGTVVELYATDTLTSRHHEKGEPVTAVAGVDVLDADGYAVIPAGAVFSGTISDIEPAESPGGEGRMVLTFNRVAFGGKTYAVQARVDTLAAYMKGRGVTGGEAVKVGAGAVIGAIAGRLLGGNKKGTAIGAAAGAAAGVGYAAATRDIDIILPAGALVRIVLTAPFLLEELI